ncbi:unnamed protein product [Didymodactylos carnosus]|uniref:Uncharacterized protein n=1 Tax=Didymodactylos carnosus TaxID=1234261 RepID=A0A814ZSV8_9BILA|nr:unnamed protein product [Didymodactylos carnosus]CAF1247787.1 unnamed protein product [Didymodactylos carnosus]CAF3650011.1 unnamed protein product [Didymodactylos carnosus]CAF4014856.1 unnamed protein product [Didymodactylos carnosus]
MIIICDTLDRYMNIDKKIIQCHVIDDVADLIQHNKHLKLIIFIPSYATLLPEVRQILINSSRYIHSLYVYRNNIIPPLTLNLHETIFSDQYFYSYLMLVQMEMYYLQANDYHRTNENALANLCRQYAIELSENMDRLCLISEVESSHP